MTRLEFSKLVFLFSVASASAALIFNGCSDSLSRELRADLVVQESKSVEGQKNDDIKLKTLPAQLASDKTKNKSFKDPSDELQIAHGKYLVHQVAQCVQCHTPRDQRGELIESQWMTGAAIPVTGPNRSQPWAAKSISLAGLGNYDESFVRHLLTHGARPDGTHPKNPMPSFKLNQNDADAVVAYLKSL